MIKKIIQLNDCIRHCLQKYTQDVFLLLIRVGVALPFFNSGLLKAEMWSSTLYLFEQEYNVPVLNFEIAAYLGTTVELVFPVLLLLGIFTPINALILFLFNIVAVVSYPIIWESGFYDHKMWGLALFVIMLMGAGKFSLDALLHRRKAVKF